MYHKLSLSFSFHSVQSRMAVGYAPDGSVAPLYDLGWEGPAGQMFSTTDDLNKVWFVSSLHSKMAIQFKSLHHDGIILPLLHPILQLAQFFYVAADQNASHFAMENTVLSAEFRREMELQGKWWNGREDSCCEVISTL